MARDLSLGPEGTHEESTSGSHAVAQPDIKQAAASASTRSALLGAIFLMATSAIGPGFLTQTAVFTAKHGAAFAFAILVSIIIDIAVQMNVWRVIGLSGMRAQELGNRVIPGFGWLMAVLIAIGGIVFNVGNIAGTGMGVNAMFGGDVKLAGVVSAALAITVFLSKRMGVALDKILVVLGVSMLLLTLYVAVVSHPPVGSALKNTVLPSEVDFLTITTLVGGTVGGYITYAGAHRMLDSGQTGRKYVSQVAQSSFTGIILTGLMRVLLFLALLGVVSAGTKLDLAGNPAADAFQAAAGEIGLRFFGFVLWSASISSVIGASYTSATFLIPNKPEMRRTQNIVTIVFILLSTGMFVALGTAPATLMVFAGAFNGLVLPLGFTLIMFVAMFRQKELLDNYKYPTWLIILGLIGVVIAWWLAFISFGGVFDLLRA